MTDHATIGGARVILEETRVKMSTTYDGMMLVKACDELMKLISPRLSEGAQTALKRFSEIADLYDDAEDDAFDIWCDDDRREIRSLKLGDFRMMRALSAELAARRSAAEPPKRAVASKPVKTPKPPKVAS